MASRILTQEIEGRHSLIGSPEQAWRSLAWFGGVLSLIGWAQVALHAYPWGLGSREWEFAVTAQMLGALPLPTIGLAAVLAAASALANRRGLLTIGVALALLGVGIGILLVLFWLVVPLALQAPEAAQITIRQTIGRTTIAGLGFGLLYLAGAVVALKRVTRTRP